MLAERPQQFLPAPAAAIQAGKQQARPDQQRRQNLPAGRARAVQQAHQGQQDQQGGGKGEQGRTALERRGGRPGRFDLQHGAAIQRSRLRVSTRMPTAKQASSGAKVLLWRGVQPAGPATPSRNIVPR